MLSLAQKLDSAPDLEGFSSMLRDDCDLEVEMGPSRNLNELFEQLNAQNITVVSLRNKANRLEELFMRLVESKQNNVVESADA